MQGFFNVITSDSAKAASDEQNYFLLFNIKIKVEEIIHITIALIINEFSFCEIPIKKSLINITKKKTYAMVSIGIDLLNVAKANINPRANCREAHI